jgi:hypothetical protein
LILSQGFAREASPIIWLAHNWAIPGKIACVLIGISGVTAVIGISLLIWFEYDLCELRKRIAAANNYSFGVNEKAGFEIKYTDEHPFARGSHILASLITVCIAAAVLAIFAVIYSPLK